MSDRIGRTRRRLAKLISESFDVDCAAEDLKAAGGRQRNNTSQYDAYAWEVFATTKSGHPFVAGSFDTMTECVKHGALTINNGEISIDYKAGKK